MIWYWRAHQLFSTEVLDHRLALLDEVLALLITELSRQQQRYFAHSLDSLIQQKEKFYD